MNERIRELTEQAGFMDSWFSESGDDCERELKKFAQLIVRECLDIMSKTSKEAEERFTYMGDDVPTTVHQSNISEHFGVEE